MKIGMELVITHKYPSESIWLTQIKKSLLIHSQYQKIPPHSYIQIGRIDHCLRVVLQLHLFADRRLQVPAAHAVGGHLRVEDDVQSRIVAVHRRLCVGSARAEILRRCEGERYGEIFIRQLFYYNVLLTLNCAVMFDANSGDFRNRVLIANSFVLTIGWK